ncbi:MAG: DUF3261 domain-containing protein [Gammaproteobacteria bacterium]|jgi:hypothetical protein
MRKHSLAVCAHALILVSLLTACGSDRCPTLPGGVNYCLQSPASGPSFSVLQQVVTGEGEQQETLLAFIENNPRRLALVGLTPLGQTVLTVTWDGKHIVASGPPGTGARIKPAVLVAVLQFGLWPQDAVRAGLAEDVIWNDDGADGQLVSQGVSLLTIHRTGQAAPYDTLSITLHPAKLLMNIHTLTDEACCGVDTAP